MKGFTLVEVLVTITITVLVGALLLVIMVNSAGLFYKESSKVEQGLGANDALAKIRATIKGSSSVAAVYPPTGSPLYTTSANQLVLKVPSLDSSGNTISNVSDYFVFFLDSNRLKWKSFPESSQSSRTAVDQILSQNVDSLFFQYLDSSVPPQEVSPTSATKIKMTLTLRQKSGAGFEKSVATSEANLRND